jgi:hypothetical protein
MWFASKIVLESQQRREGWRLSGAGYVKSRAVDVDGTALENQGS